MHPQLDVELTKMVALEKRLYLTFFYTFRQSENIGRLPSQRYLNLLNSIIA